MKGLKPGEKYAFKFYLTSPLKDDGSDKYVIKSPYLSYIKDESPLPELAYTGKRINEAPLNDTEDFADEESKRNYLAVPERALYNRKDLLNGKLRGQRDFPEELVAKKIRLLDDLYKPHDQYKRGWLGSSSPLGSELINTDLRYMSNEDARKWVMDHFEIDPEYIISDEACKVIYDDMSNDYEKHSRQGNIVNGLSGGDNKWR